MAVSSILDEDVYTKRDVARDPDTESVKLLTQLAGDEDKWVRTFVAANPNTPEDVRRSLMHEGIVILPCAIEVLGMDYQLTDSFWKGNVCDNFNDNVVIVDSCSNAESSIDVYDVEEADWWYEAVDVWNDVVSADCSTDNTDDAIAELRSKYANLPESVLREIYEFCDGERWLNNDIRYLISMHMHPELNLKMARIEGYNKYQHATVIYNSNVVELDILRDWYYQNVLSLTLCRCDYSDMMRYFDSVSSERLDDIGSDVLWEFRVDADNGYDVDHALITSSYYNELYTQGKLKSELAKIFDLHEDFDLF